MSYYYFLHGENLERPLKAFLRAVIYCPEQGGYNFSGP